MIFTCPGQGQVDLQCPGRGFFAIHLYYTWNSVTKSCMMIMTVHFCNYFQRYVSTMAFIVYSVDTCKCPYYLLLLSLITGSLSFLTLDSSWRVEPPDCGSHSCSEGTPVGRSHGWSSGLGSSCCLLQTGKKKKIKSIDFTIRISLL